MCVPRPLILTDVQNQTDGLWGRGTLMKARLLVVQGRPQGKSLLFPPGEYVFGRGPECAIRPNSEWVSRQHCLLRVTEEGLSIRDIGSRNGTLVNGMRITAETALKHGDTLSVGPLMFEVRLEEKSGGRGQGNEGDTVSPQDPRTDCPSDSALATPQSEADPSVTPGPAPAFPRAELAVPRS